MGGVEVRHFIPERYYSELTAQKTVYTDETLYERLKELQSNMRSNYERLAEQIGDMQLDTYGPRKTSKIRIIMHPEAVHEFGSNNGVDVIAKRFDEIGKKLDSLGIFISCLRNRLDRKKLENIFS